MYVNDVLQTFHRIDLLLLTTVAARITVVFSAATKEGQPAHPLSAVRAALVSRLLLALPKRNLQLFLQASS